MQPLDTTYKFSFNLANCGPHGIKGFLMCFSFFLPSISSSSLQQLFLWFSYHTLFLSRFWLIFQFYKNMYKVWDNHSKYYLGSSRSGYYYCGGRCYVELFPVLDGGIAVEVYNDFKYFFFCRNIKGGWKFQTLQFNSQNNNMHKHNNHLQNKPLRSSSLILRWSQQSRDTFQPSISKFVHLNPIKTTFKK